MMFSVQPQMRAKIIQQYKEYMASYPQKQEEVEAFLQGKAESYCLCLQFLYGHMPVNDILSFPVKMLAGYVEATLQAYEAIDYMKAIPLEIFFPYVLNHRVNSECLDGSRAVLMEQILPYVRGKSMTQAALVVNAWCYAHATYTPADDRTLGPLAVMRRTLGRCGEESVLAVAALRSVGIPARQCYCPRWSHCDDNHAWVEVWVDGDWHYLGACEPEPVLDKGWFTAAASRAMLVHTKQWSRLEDVAALQTMPIYQEISCTARYADLRMLTVQVTQRGVPLQNVAVAFQIVNYSELFTLHQSRTDEKGFARFETGLGDLCVYVYHKGKMLLQKVDMRTFAGVLVLDVSQGYGLENLPGQIAMDLVPPVGRNDVTTQIENEAHTQMLRACEAHRGKITGLFRSGEGKRVSDMALREAAGNWPQIQAFLEDGRYALAEKEEILQTLRPKDFVDITCEVLVDALDTAQPVRDRYALDLFRDYILAPRVADEMLQPERARLRDLFPNGFADPAEILAWMQTNMQIMDDYGVNNYAPSAYGCLFYRQVPAASFDLVFVALCRAFRFPARLAPDTGEGQWLDGANQWHSIHNRKSAATVALTLVNPTDSQLVYQEHFSLGCWDGQDFVTLRYPGLTMEKHCQLSVRPGLYRILTTTRQIDGTASVHLRHLRVDADCAVRLEMPEDQTARRLKRVPLTVPQGDAQAALQELDGQNGILIFAEPGSEPTEHLLQEMLECANGFRQSACAIGILVAKPEDLDNATLQRVRAALRNVQVQVCWDPEGEAALHRLMQVGDLRRPFVITVDTEGRGVYASANYNIRMAQTLLRIQTLLRSET